MHILAHRGITERTLHYESTFGAFQDACTAGFGIEADINISSDGVVFIFHDTDTKRLSPSGEVRRFSDLQFHVIQRMFHARNEQACQLHDALSILNHAKGSYGAIHIKSMFQTKTVLRSILKELDKFSQLRKRLLFFDLTVDSATYMKSQNPFLQLSCSVAHEFDIERFNQTVGYTLMSLGQAIEHKDLYNWAWMDEWDLKAKRGYKKLNTHDNFLALRKSGYNIALVGPELHGHTNKGLSEHEDAKSVSAMKKRYAQLIELRPDVICTDFPNLVLSMYEKNS